MELNDIYKLYAPYIVRLELFPDLKKIKDQNIKLDLSSPMHISGTGFFIGNYLVTNFHIFKNVLSIISDVPYQLWTFLYNTRIIPSDIFCKSENTPITDLMIGAFKYEKNEILSSRTGYYSEDIYNDYIILHFNRVNIDPEQLEEITLSNGQTIKTFKNVTYKPLEFLSGNHVKIGNEVCFFGYPFGKENLSLHKGIISSIYKKNDVTVYQIDGNINNGHSGGPLIDVKTGKIIGIVSRKENGFTDYFKKIKSQINAKGVCSDCLKTLISQMERSANVGIGYAFSSDRIADNLMMLSEYEDN